MTTRRNLLALGLAVAMPALPAPAQPASSVPRIGYLAVIDPAATPHLQAFRDGLRERGYTEGRNIRIDYQWSSDTRERLPQLAAELVRQKVDVIVTWGTAASMAARDATKTIPIVMFSVTDPVATGLVASFGRPGGNVTGTSNFTADLSAKVVELMLQIAPNTKRLIALRNPDNPSSRLQLAEAESAARAFKLPLQVVNVSAVPELEAAFAAMATQRNASLVVLTDPMFVTQSGALARLALKHRLPAFFVRRENAVAGGLLSYGSSISDEFRGSAVYVDKILKGAKPADLPVERPTRFELVINLRTAHALGLKAPKDLLLRADEVIE